jgi:Holliday junction resolvasome RuvABC endonuclease subunit
MIQPHQKYFRVLAISPSTRGFGYAVLEGEQTLVDWGVKHVETDRNAQCVAKVKEMLIHYRPDVMVLQDHSGKDSRRSIRIRTLSGQIVALASKQKVKIMLFSRDQVVRLFVPNGKATRHARAELLATRFPSELGLRLPPKRRPWMSEDYRMDIFDAVALALALRLKETKQMVKGLSETG